jgi:hypothetical protein
MNGKTRIQVVAALVVLVFAVGIWSTGGGAKLQWLRFYSGAVLVAVAALGAWDRFLWHVRLSQRLKAVPRDIRGTWKGTLTSHWIDPKTGISPEPKPAYLVVRQSFTSVSVMMFTDESRSRSSLSDVSTGDELLSLDYMYFNRPDNSIEDRSRRHSGSTALDVIGNPVNRMSGHYWTDRDTRGDLEFVERVREFADDYGSAEVLFRGCK